ncbi:MAG: hypothetical protein D3903_16205 [Candidatus Electrothrix sp. GM3_4]|nr:hypothetical protein [Candidatus Electrothrix sp. GM3_4]
MKDEYDFSDAEQGKFYRPVSKLEIPLMKPKLYERAGNLNFSGIDKLISGIKNFECSTFFAGYLDEDQAGQKKIVDKFQKELFEKLAKIIPDIDWKIEFVLSSKNKDAVDIYGDDGERVIVIEIDKHRADQVAKKFVSRNALLIKKDICYISLCCPGTKRMSKGECIKFFGYCGQLSQYMGNEYVAFIIE